MKYWRLKSQGTSSVAQMPPKPDFPTSLTAHAINTLGIPRATKLTQATLTNGEYLCVVHDDHRTEYLVHEGWLFERTEGDGLTEETISWCGGCVMLNNP